MFGFGKVVEVATILLGHEVVKNGLEKLGKITVERIETLIKLEPRQIFVETMRHFEEEDRAKAQILWDRVEETRRYGAENIVVNALGSIVPREKGNPDFKRGVGIYAWLADMPPPKFVQAMDRLKHDPIAQPARYYTKLGVNALQEFIGVLTEESHLRTHELAGYAAADLPHLRNKINQAAARIGQQLDERRERKRQRGVFYRLLANDPIELPRLPAAAPHASCSPATNSQPIHHTVEEVI